MVRCSLPGSLVCQKRAALRPRMGPVLSAVVGFRCGRRANRLFYKVRYKISGIRNQ